VNRRPESFNAVAALYDRARPAYPQELLDDLWTLTGIRPGARVLEIGCGTGQITVPLARHGLRVTALEPGDALADIARQNLAGHPAAEVVEARFEDYELPAEPFDLVISATAFHWVEPSIRVAKSAAALAPGGHLAVVETHWGVGRDRDAFSQLHQPCFARWDPETEPGFVPPTIADLPTTRPELEDAAAFDSICHRHYEQINVYDTAGYLDLIRTWSNVLGLDQISRRGLLRCLGELIDGRFAGRLARSDLRMLWLARASGA
jgi:SAM-dependent methyltransferase